VFHRHVNQYSRTKIAGIACSATDLGDSVPVELAAQLEKTGTLRAHGLAPKLAQGTAAFGICFIQKHAG